MTALVPAVGQPCSTKGCERGHQDLHSVGSEPVLGDGMTLLAYTADTHAWGGRR
jgi:hypothetical protein